MVDFVIEFLSLIDVLSHPGLPLSPDSAVVHLMKHNVTVGMGVMGIMFSPQISAWSARNARFDLAWVCMPFFQIFIRMLTSSCQVYINSGDYLSKSDALALSSTNMKKLLGIKSGNVVESDLVATRGGDLLDLKSKVVAVISHRRGVVDML